MVSDKTFGRDVRTQRQDPLDTECLQRAAELALPPRSPLVLDLGCGSFGQSLALLNLGATVVAVDINADLGPKAECIGTQFSGFTFVNAPIEETILYLPQVPVDIVYSQRALHYLRQPHAVALLRTLAASAGDDARFFLSVSGTSSELGVGYEAIDRPLSERFATLSQAMASAHQIRQPVCLYSQEEFARTLDAAGLRVVNIWSSEFGNVKAIAVKPS